MVNELSITLDPGPAAEGQYTPGSIVSGTLIVETDKPKDYKKLVIRMKGKGFVSWSSGSGDNKRHHSQREVYVDLQEVLWVSEDSFNGTFPVGRHTYLFQFKLPSTCPSSITSPLGNIIYKIKGVLSTGPGTLKRNRTVKQSFDVIEMVSTAPSPSVHFEKRKIVGCGLCQSGEINLTVQLPSAGFTTGEEVLVSGHIENGSGRRIALKYTLEERITYMVRTLEHRITVVLSSQNGEVILPHSESDISIHFPIPPCRPAMAHSTIIKSEHLFVVTMVIPRAINSSAATPIMIGNVTQ